PALSMLWSFFFSSRRRHTRFSRDWSSDVCSSDLAVRERVRRGLPQRAIAIDRLTDRDVTVEECEAAFSAGFEKALDITLEPLELDRKSTRLNSSHVKTSYAVFCLKKKKRLTGSFT